MRRRERDCIRRAAGVAVRRECRFDPSAPASNPRGAVSPDERASRRRPGRHRSTILSGGPGLHQPDDDDRAGPAVGRSRDQQLAPGDCGAGRDHGPARSAQSRYRRAGRENLGADGEGRRQATRARRVLTARRRASQDGHPDRGRAGGGLAAVSPLPRTRDGFDRRSPRGAAGRAGRQPARGAGSRQSDPECGGSAGRPRRARDHADGVARRRRHSLRGVGQRARLRPVGRAIGRAHHFSRRRRAARRDWASPSHEGSSRPTAVGSRLRARFPHESSFPGRRPSRSRNKGSRRIKRKMVKGIKASERFLGFLSRGGGELVGQIQPVQLVDERRPAQPQESRRLPLVAARLLQTADDQLPLEL